jgi:predicted enzyme related to lactoylglutathione lyase
MITKVAFVGHRVSDMEKARRFYGELLGLKYSASYGEGKWVEYDTPEGKTVALDTFSPAGTGPYMALESDNIEADMQRLKEAGVTVVKDVWDNQVCKMALITDPDGNVVMLHQTASHRKAT